MELERSERAGRQANRKRASVRARGGEGGGQCLNFKAVTAVEGGSSRRSSSSGKSVSVDYSPPPH